MAHQYKKYTHLEHILARPDTYVGSLIPDISKQWVFEKTENVPRAILKQVSHVGGLFKIFDEILVNAVDQCVLPDNRVDKITVDVNVHDYSVSIMNTGNGVPVEQHPDHDNIWVPELIFGELLTSSNYNDNEARITGGRNGYGAKLANVFSKRFQVDTVCTRNHKRYIQEWGDNMTTKKKAKITSKSTSNGYTRITFWPDLERFGLQTLDQDDILLLFERRTYDICACTPANVRVSYNGKSLGIKSFDKYVDCYIGNKKEQQRVYEQSDDGRWEIALSQSDQGFQQVSFVNGIHTSLGGTHVDYVSSQLVKRITEHIISKHKDLKVKPQQIKEHLFLFVKSTLTNPTFSSQTKTECTSRWKDFGTVYRVSDEFIKKTVKLPFMDDIVSMVKHRESRELNKTDGRKLSVIKGIPKLEDANKAGTTQSSRCTLILTEGDSAKTFAISGLSVVGRDYYGVFPLKGKLLNVRDATNKQLMNNEEITNIKQILGLQNGKEYTSTRDLRYGKVLILTDADVDGSHIKGLFINFVHHFWPSLLENVPDFLMSMRTPILKCSKGKNNTLSFYTKQEYDKWKSNTSGYKSWSVKYYKGLGTSTAQEARDYFRDFERCKITYSYDKTNKTDIELAFKKTLTNERKAWIQEGCISKKTLGGENTVNVSDFIHKDLRWFSIADNERSIPNVMDGLKPSQRKVLYALRKRTKGDIKVSQLSGYVSTETCYHHGEQSLMGTIINMAQDYVGSNNINLLQPKGQFGTRLMGGKDAASPRYIFTELNDVTERLFDSRDDAVLTHLEDDGSKIEPMYFVPILPMVLINGADGIGTGYSTQVPCYSPKAVEDNVIRCLNGESQAPMTPWYRGFKGTIEKVSDGRFMTHGVWYRGSELTIEITELPIGKWTSDYKEFLDNLLVADTIKGFENHSTETDVRFIIRLANTTSDEDVEKKFKLSSTLSASNMHLFDKDGCIVHYQSPESIIEAFVQTRILYYKLRKEHLLKTYRATHYELSEKIRFINLVINEDIRVFRKTREYITKAMNDHKFDTTLHETLLNIRISAFTEDQIRTLQGKVDEFSTLIHKLDNKTNKELWIEDLRK